MRNLRLWAYLAVALAMAGLALLTPAVWATPNNQGTVPTMTSPSQPRPTAIVPTLPPEKPGPAPTGAPRGPAATAAPQPAPTQAGQPEATPLPTDMLLPTPADTETPASAAGPTLDLKVVTVPQAAWPGATIQFTVTLANSGPAPIRQIVVVNTLSAGLAPGPLPTGSPAIWQGQALRLEVPVLAPGAQVVMPFNAGVQRDVEAGNVLQSVAVATAATGERGFVQTLLPLPPAELPRTGQSFAIGF